MSFGTFLSLRLYNEFHGRRFVLLKQFSLAVDVFDMRRAHFNRLKSEVSIPTHSNTACLYGRRLLCLVHNGRSSLGLFFSVARGRLNLYIVYSDAQVGYIGNRTFAYRFLLKFFGGSCKANLVLTELIQ